MQPPTAQTPTPKPPAAGRDPVSLGGGGRGPMPDGVSQGLAGAGPDPRDGCEGRPRAPALQLQPCPCACPWGLGNERCCPLASRDAVGGGRGGRGGLSVLAVGPGATAAVGLFSNRHGRGGSTRRHPRRGGARRGHPAVLGKGPPRAPVAASSGPGARGRHTDEWRQPRPPAPEMSQSGRNPAVTLKYYGLRNLRLH